MTAKRDARAKLFLCQSNQLLFCRSRAYGADVAVVVASVVSFTVQKETRSQEKVIEREAKLCIYLLMLD